MNFVHSIIVSVIVFLVLTIPNNSSIAQPYACLPNCDTDDSRNFIVAGPNLNSFVDNRFKFGLSSPANSPSIEIGIFDGDDATNFTAPEIFSDWDSGGVAVLVFTLYADPTGEGAEDIMLGQWLGTIMPDDDWFNITVPNVPEAQSENGNFRYSFKVEVGAVDPASLNSFSLRTDGSMIIFPFETFFFLSQVVTNNNFEDVYPNFTLEALNDPQCYDPIVFDNVCVAGDPGCCLSGGTYDGSYTFFLDVTEGDGSIECWDGDFDYGSSTNPPHFGCVPDFVDVDTDDANTPNEIPDFAEGTNAVAEGISIPADPLDDSCNNFGVRRPSVFYSIISPEGDVYTNENPSGTEEWELFLITSEGGGDVDLNNVPGGIWRVQVEGLDLFNLNGFRINFPVIAVNEEGEPVDFDPPLTPIPTLSEWALISLTAVMFILSIIYLRRKKTELTESKLEGRM